MKLLPGRRVCHLVNDISKSFLWGWTCGSKRCSCITFEDTPLLSLLLHQKEKVMGTSVLFATPSERKGTMDLFEFQGAWRYGAALWLCYLLAELCKHQEIVSLCTSGWDLCPASLMLNFAFIFYPYNRNSETTFLELWNILQTYICMSQHTFPRRKTSKYLSTVDQSHTTCTKSCGLLYSCIWVSMSNNELCILVTALPYSSWWWLTFTIYRKTFFYL